MRTEIHPKYDDVQVTCSCGNVFTTRSTKTGAMHVELCNECHPFFTGRQKLVDTGGRVERFQKRYAGTEVKSKKRQKAEIAPAEAAAEGE
jgi:large subunit ribosomal protein L31